MAAARRADPPGPRGLPVVGNAAAFIQDPVGFCRRTARRYGDVVLVRVPLLPFYLVNHPHDIERILLRDADVFRKERYTRALGEVLGEGLVVSDGAHWKRQRRLVQRAFIPRRVDGYAQIVVDEAERAASRWREGETIDVHGEMMRLTLQIVAKALFSADVSSEADAVGRALDITMRHFLGIGGTGLRLPRALPTPGNRRQARAIAELDRIIYGLIATRRRDGEDRGDLLSMLLAAHDDDGSTMSDRQLRDELVTLFLAGHETTALVLTFTFYLLARHPAADSALRDELGRKLGARPPRLDDVRDLAVTDGILKESMRLYPPVWGIGREPLRDYEVGGYVIPRGGQVFLTQAIVHHDPRFYPDPDRFAPERWTPSFERALPKFAYFPFGGGPRVCVGASFAMMEAALVLATIARRHTLSLAPGARLALMPSVTLRPKHGLMMRVGVASELRPVFQA